MSAEKMQALLDKLTPDEQSIIAALVNDKLKAEAERQALYEVALNIIDLFGILDENKRIRPEVASGEDNIIKYIFPALSDTVSMFMQAKMGIGGMRKRAEEKIEQKFAFTKKLVPIIQEYAGK